MTKEVKLGIFVLFGLATLLASIFAIKDIRLEKGYTLYINYDDTGGLMEKAWVRSAGVKIGKVEKISLENSRAKVKLWIWGNTKVYNDAVVTIMATGLLGVKYVNLTLGTPAATLLKNGSTLEGINPMSTEKMISQAMDSMSGLVGTLNDLSGEGKLAGNINKLIENIKLLSDRLETALSREDVENIVDDIKTTADNLSKLSSDMIELVDKNKESAEQAIENVSSASKKLDEMLVKIQEKDTALGKLISDKEMGKQVEQTINALEETAQNAKEVLAKFGAIHTYWDYRLRYDGTSSLTRSDFGLKIAPSEGKFYFLSVNNISDSNLIDAYQKQNTFTGAIGKEFNNSVSLYAGLIRSAGGVGCTWEPLASGWLGDNLSKINLELNIEFFDFSRRSPTTLPVGIIATQVWLTKWLRWGIQSEDVFAAASWHTYFNIVFEDKDIAYLLGLVSLAKP